MNHLLLDYVIFSLDQVVSLIGEGIWNLLYLPNVIRCFQAVQWGSFSSQLCRWGLIEFELSFKIVRFIYNSYVGAWWPDIFCTWMVLLFRMNNLHNCSVSLLYQTRLQSRDVQHVLLIIWYFVTKNVFGLILRLQTRE